MRAFWVSVSGVTAGGTRAELETGTDTGRGGAVVARVRAPEDGPGVERTAVGSEEREAGCEWEVPAREAEVLSAETAELVWEGMEIKGGCETTPGTLTLLPDVARIVVETRTFPLWADK